MKTFAVLLLAFAVASIDCEKDREKNSFKTSRDENRVHAREVIHEAAKFINEQNHIEPAERLDLLKKLLKYEIDFDEVIQMIEKMPGKQNVEYDKKFQMRAEEIKQKLNALKKDIPDHVRERIKERYVNQEKLNGSL